jgi:2,4-dihydroxyhept-2-ene-1,7-dioic acid aldolase
MEHAPLDIYDVELLLMGLRGGVVGIVRVPWNDTVYIKRALDVGPQGILVPWVSTYEEALAVERYVTYPLEGSGVLSLGGLLCMAPYPERSIMRNT